VIFPEIPKSQILWYSIAYSYGSQKLCNYVNNSIPIYVINVIPTTIYSTAPPPTPLYLDCMIIACIGINPTLVSHQDIGGLTMKALTFLLAVCLTIAASFSTANCTTIADCVVTLDLSSLSITTDSPDVQIYSGHSDPANGRFGSPQFLTEGGYAMFDAVTAPETDSRVELPTQIDRTHSTMELVGSSSVFPGEGDSPFLSAHSVVDIPDDVSFNAHVEAGIFTSTWFGFWGDESIYGNESITTTITIDYYVTSYLERGEFAIATTDAYIEAQLFDISIDPLTEDRTEPFSLYSTITSVLEDPLSESNEWSGQLSLIADLSPIVSQHTFTFGVNAQAWADASQYVPDSNPAPVPEPATLLLFGTGLVGLAGIGRKKLKK